MAMLETIRWKQRLAARWAARIRLLKEVQTFSVNRRDARPSASKTVAMLLPADVRERVERVASKWGIASFARTAQTAMMVGLEVMESDSKTWLPVLGGEEQE